MELVPLNREKLSTSLNMAKIPTKKVKVQVEACQTFPFCCDLAEKGLTGFDLDFHFFSKDFCHIS